MAKLGGPWVQMHAYFQSFEQALGTVAYIKEMGTPPWLIFPPYKQLGKDVCAPHEFAPKKNPYRDGHRSRGSHDHFNIDMVGEGALE